MQEDLGMVLLMDKIFNLLNAIQKKRLISTLLKSAKIKISNFLNKKRSQVKRFGLPKKERVDISSSNLQHVSEGFLTLI